MMAKTVLLVEDNGDEVELTLRAFRENRVPCDIRVARDGAEAIEQLLGDGEAGTDALPAVVLLDLHLPGIDGFGVLERIRAEARTALLPVVVMTSSDERSDVLHSYRLGANSFVRKPVTFRELVDLTRRLSDYWLDVNRGPSPA
jgi:two-component system response regulator